jgi:hypothetical protein
MPSKKLVFSRCIGGFAADTAGNRGHLGRLRLPKSHHRVSPVIKWLSSSVYLNHDIVTVIQQRSSGLRLVLASTR